MKKLKDLLKESNIWDREFGQPLPTLEDAIEDHQSKKLKEGSAQDYKKVQKLLTQVKSGLSELIKYGEDYSVFQSAKYAAKTLKKAWRDISRIT